MIGRSQDLPTSLLFEAVKVDFLKQPMTLGAFGLKPRFNHLNDGHFLYHESYRMRITLTVVILNKVGDSTHQRPDDSV